MPNHNTSSGPITDSKLKNNMTESERLQRNALSVQTNRMWRNFWIGVAHRMGYSNVEIARKFELTESTIRSVLKKGH